MTNDQQRNLLQSDADDARRYRWLKDNCIYVEKSMNGVGFDYIELCFQHELINPNDPDSLDVAIDDMKGRNDD